MAENDEDDLRTYQQRVAQQFTIDISTSFHATAFLRGKDLFYKQSEGGGDSTGNVDKEMSFDDIIGFMGYLQTHGEDGSLTHSVVSEMLLCSVKKVEDRVPYNQLKQRWKMWTRISLVPGIISLGVLVTVLVLTKAAPPIWTAAAIVEYVMPVMSSALFLTLTAVCAWKKSVNQRLGSNMEDIFNEIRRIIQSASVCADTSRNSLSTPLLFSGHEQKSSIALDDRKPPAANLATPFKSSRIGSTH